MAVIPESIGRPPARMVASVPVGTPRFCRTYRKVGVCLGSKYRFCVPQNRRTCRRASGHGSRKEVA